MNFYPRHIGDYLKDTAHLSLLEHGVYSRLLDVYYTRETPIPDAEVYRLVGARSKDERGAVETVLNEFFKLSDGAWSHKRCDEEIARYQKRVEHNRTVGQKGGRPRTKREPEANPEETRMVSKQNPSQEPRTITNSVPNGTGASAPTDRDMVFANGVPLLTAAGVKESNARSFLAAQCKAHGEGAVLQALTNCANERPVQPVSWIQSALGSPGKPRKSDALMAGNIAAAQRFLEGKV